MFLKIFSGFFVIFGFAAIFFFSISNTEVARATNSNKSTNSHRESKMLIGNLQLIKSDDPMFDRILNEYVFGRIQTINKVVEDKPFVVFLKNNTNQNIARVSIRWTVQLENGSILVLPQFFSNMPSDYERVLSEGLDREAFTLIGVNQLKFVDLFNTSETEKIHKSKGYFANDNSNEFSESGISRLSRASNQSSRLKLIDVTIDGVFFIDGSFSGANKNYWLEMIQGEVAAGNDVKEMANKDRTKRKSSSMVLDEIQEEIKKKLVSTPSPKANPSFGNPKEAFDSGYRRALSNIQQELDIKRMRRDDISVLIDYVIPKRDNKN